ncbi:predicted protein [Nematostella vectensis]|uniref:RING finger protein 141 n=1 Tax=Nematostella vectensis TaxID=45351 RepID=A7RIK5_NEMVE|nr:RING finger protein 141 [Nematostella vectensis]EDO48726.1 predicted protein [Nematostella vectensis]|eukprot:XP_001640789.1 predicted protein [Nematostella vectensis]
MGQHYSFASKVLQDHALVLRDFAVLSHEGLLDTVKHINKILQMFSEDSSKQILFSVKEMSDDNYLWKATVRIFCFKIDKRTGSIQTRKVLDLRQFCKVYRDVTKQVRCTKTMDDEEQWEEVDKDGQSYHTISLEQARETLSASMIFSRVDEATSEGMEECCICMEQQSEIILACVHSFCKSCIDRWSDSHNTCPICRDLLEKKDTWEMPAAPSKTEVAQYVMGLAEGAGNPS